MTKTLFETKIKDGLGLLAVVLIIMITSLTLDDIRGSLKTGKMRIWVYVPSYDIPVEGPVLKAGDPIKLYKSVVGRVAQVDYFVVRIKMPVRSSSAMGPTTATTPTAPISKTKPFRPEIVTGMKIRCELFAADFPAIIATVSLDAHGKIESPALGEPSLILIPVPTGRSVHEGDRVGFPHNNLDVVDPTDEKAILGEELTDPDQIAKAREDAARAMGSGASHAPPAGGDSDL